MYLNICELNILNYNYEIDMEKRIEQIEINLTF